MYWDDGWAIAAALLDAIVLACLWVRVHFINGRWLLILLWFRVELIFYLQCPVKVW